MGKINLLEKHVAELIAAGEVVERPASVIKELVENSIDAGATSVSVEIQNGGAVMMRVTDNGSGIAREDVPTAFLRHATSKVLHEEDLESIGTLGFRGEALASVAAVARIDLLTRTEEELAGTHYVIEGGEEQAFEDAGCARGTVLTVRDIFFNTPARMKFLKKDTVESNAVAAVMDKIALSHPEIAVRFVRDGKETLRSPGDGQLKSAVFAVFGREFTAGLIPVEYELQGIKATGFVSKPSHARPNRSMQQFFINGRTIRSRTAQVALEQAFKGSLMVGKFPACVLHMQIPVQAVDVNVHPGKLEVRFINERPVFDAVYYGVKTALAKGDSANKILLPVKPEQPEPQHVKATTSSLPFDVQDTKPQQIAMPAIFGTASSAAPALNDSALEDPVEIAVPTTPAYCNAEASPSRLLEERRWQDTRSTLPVHTQEKEIAPSASEPEEWSVTPSGDAVPASTAFVHNPEEMPITEPTEQAQSTIAFASPNAVEQLEGQPSAQAQGDFRYIGHVFGTYILLERVGDEGEELVLVDRHAAHERLLYERLKEQSGTAFSQMLLTPVPVLLEKNEYAAVLASLELCETAGFEIDDFGGGTVLVRSAPLSLTGEDIPDAVMEIAGYLAQSRTDVTTEHLDWLYHNIACRAAMKAHDDRSPEELIALVRQLDENPQLRYCPHGRPISIVLTRKELERQFGRA
ncbi:MAG: DNA mismatch repair endonuclease MutL [Clostridium sp.]|uniref:DNA mismatch repair endonuclease MutL n=1 Tax=Clostridium sp. TaxID=1506 RepID=UPI00290765D8|nr:DNA mismatch repair endonuclease MutL [Clostridium sp.]MDU7337546.1 DNA mismatch repair endonuclease MutL [Clostridium sp.]